ANHSVSGGMIGLDLGTKAVDVFKSLVEATAFGSKAIVERFSEENVPIREVIAIGGVALKSNFVMQVLSDVLNMPIKVSSADQACALGAGMCAATAAGLYPSIPAAQKSMGAGFSKIYTPNVNRVQIYKNLYTKYLQLGNFIEKKQETYV